MTKNKQNVPQVRFKGFTDDWEQRKLGEVTDCIKNGYTYKADGSRDHKYKITRIETISSGVINTEKLGSSDEANENYKLVEGDILFSHINSLPYIANTAIYTANLGEIYHGMNLLNIRAKQNIIDVYFLLYLLKKESNRDWFRTIAKPAVNQASISTTEVALFEFQTPNIKEQHQIGTYFRTLDHLITLHQRKCETLQKLKKSMLQKMFPKNGSHFPEIRFKGFTDAWEQREFGELYRKVSEKNDGSIGTDRNITVASMQFKDDIQVSSAEYLKTYYTFNLGDIAFEGHHSKEFKFGRFVENDIGNGIVSHIFAVFRPTSEYDLYYWKYAINNEYIMQKILSRSTKASTMMHDLVTDDFLKEKIAVPSLAEQRQIGSILNGLDTLITLHQRKLETLKKLKKAMLQKMFI